MVGRLRERFTPHRACQSGLAARPQKACAECKAATKDRINGGCTDFGWHPPDEGAGLNQAEGRLGRVPD
jgi:hypothetical protein